MSALEQPQLEFAPADSPSQRAELSNLSPKANPHKISGAELARQRAESKRAWAAFEVPKPGDKNRESRQAPLVGHFEKLAVNRLGDYLFSSAPRPLFSLCERDIIIQNPKAYFDSIRKNVVLEYPDGESLKVRRNRADAQARKGRTRAYGERLIESLATVDNCRSWRWYLLDGGLRPVHISDSPPTIQRRVAVDLVDLLDQARMRGLLAGGRSRKVSDSLQVSFDSVNYPMAGDGPPAEEIELAIKLTVLIGKNAVLRANEWQTRFEKISKGHRIFDPDLLEIFEQFNDIRSGSHRQHYDPLVNLLAKLNSNQAT